jgi:enamine deaminase RidA (YjgF/YER057c/UK114 family)
VFCSGQLPTEGGVLKYQGQVGEEITADEAQAAARMATLNCLAAIKLVVGELDRVSQIVRVTGYVNSALGFTGQPAVINGASDLLLEVFGDAGRHSRVAVGVAELPLDAAVEIEMIVETR